MINSLIIGVILLKILQDLNKFIKARKNKIMDPEQQFHENMAVYKNSLPQFFKNPNFVLINKDGELLEEETEALRAKISPDKEKYQETEVPFSQNDEESYYGGRTENERVIQLIPKKFKENLVYKFKEKNTNKRLNNVRAIRPKKIQNFDINSEVFPGNIEEIKGADKFSLLSPNNFINKHGNQASMASDIDSKYEVGDKSLNIKEITSGYQREGSEEGKERHYNSLLSNKEPIDMVQLQNEAFSKMFVETQIDRPFSQTVKNQDLNKNFKKSTYPRSKIPSELKQKFDLISDNFNYNDEFWKQENLENQDFKPVKIKKQVFSKIKETDEELEDSSQVFTKKRAKTTHKQGKEELLQEQIGYIKADWIDKIIKIKENLDKK